MFLEINDKPRFPLRLGQLYLLGKQICGNKTSNNSFIELEDEEDVSQRHCVIEVNQSEEVFVFDLFSLKGTLLNNIILNGLEKTRLTHGDIIKLGKSEIKYIHDKEEGFPDSILKNTSSFIASSPNMSSSRLEKAVNFLVPSVPAKILNTSAMSSSNRRSDSFIIPETQCCAEKNSTNASDLSVAESIPDDIGKINFANTFNDEDDFCIPETQELLQSAVPSNKNNTSGEGNSKSTIDGSQFRICTQDYNEGFGEEEYEESLHSLVIPIIKHQPVYLDCLNQSVNQSRVGQEEKEMSTLKCLNSKTDQSREDCVTPDIFDFDGADEVKKRIECTETLNIVDKVPAGSLMDGDEEDFLLTQAPPAVSSVKKILENKSWSESEKPCLQVNSEEVISLSDKENRCPVTLEPPEDLPATQIFEVPASKTQNLISVRKSITSAIKANSEINTTNTSLATEVDEEDFVLTQALSSSSAALNKNSIVKCLNSTLLDDKIKTQNAAAFFAEAEEVVIKPATSSLLETSFKKPNKDSSVLKKISSSTSTTSENDLDLLMCTPQLIKDNWFFGEREELKKNILAAKSRNILGDETEEEDDDDDQSDLVKLINIPKDSSDFDKLLPHLNRTHQEEKPTNEAQKIYKFNVMFGKELDDQLSKTSTSKSSMLSRDERHAARDKEKELSSERKKRTKDKDEERKADKNSKEIQMLSKEKTVNKDSTSNKLPTSKNEFSKASQKAEEKTNKKQVTSKKDSNSAKGGKNESQSTTTSESTTKKSGISTRSRKRQASSSDKKSEKEPQAQEATPAKRLTRSKSKLLDTPPTDKEDDMDSISTEPFIKTRRNRSKSRQNESQGSQTSRSSSQNNKSQSKRSKTEQKVNTTAKNIERKSKAVADVSPIKVALRRFKSSEYLKSPVSISMTMVDQEMFKELYKKSKGQWHIAANWSDSDILVMDKAVRTFKFMLAMARGIPIVTSEYLRKINESRSAKEVRINDYLFADPEFEKKHNFLFDKSLQSARTLKIFKGYEFMMTSSISPNPTEIKAIIEASGGYVHDKTPPQPKDNQKLYLVTAKVDKKNWHKYRRLNKNIIFVSTEAIMSTVMSQNLEPMNKYTF